MFAHDSLFSHSLQHSLVIVYFYSHISTAIEIVYFYAVSLIFTLDLLLA